MAAELGSTRDPKALIPGNPEAIENNARVLRTRGQAATDAGDGLRGVDTGAWGGPAATAFHDTFSYEPPKWHTVGDALVDAATALTGYADTLRWAQTQATEAIRLWEAGQRATQQAQAQHNAAVEHANQQNRANAAAGNPDTMQVAPFTDPGEQQRQAARDLLQRARQQLTEAGDRTTELLRGHTHHAPEGRDWLDELGSLAEGAWEGTQGILEFAWDHSPLRLMVDPKGFFEDKATLAQGLIGAVQNPVEFGKAAIDWDTWQNNPARAAGRLLPDLALSAATAGTGGAAIKAGRAGAKAADEAADAARVAQRVEHGGPGPVEKGRAGVEDTVREIETAGGRIAGREVTIDAGGVRTRPDLFVTRSDGADEFVEVKTGPKAGLTPNQRAAFPVIETEGGIPRGANAANAGLEPGVPIPPTPVRIVHRP